MQRTDLGPPNLFSVVKLKCLYCCKTPLLKKGSWFDFASGCQDCDYRYEREVGYYTGSSWIVNYLVISLVGIAVAAYCALATNLTGLWIASVASVVIVAFGVVWFPFGSAIWMYADHWLHPLQDDDRLTAKKSDKK